MAIERLVGYKKPGDQNPANRPYLENATNENTVIGPSYWDEMSRAEENMNQQPLRKDENGN